MDVVYDRDEVTIYKRRETPGDRVDDVVLSPSKD
jgi:hypothetical protein